MIKPRELESDKGRDIWDTITAAAAGDMPTLHRPLESEHSSKVATLPAWDHAGQPER